MRLENDEFNRVMKQVKHLPGEPHGGRFLAPLRLHGDDDDDDNDNDDDDDT